MTAYPKTASPKPARRQATLLRRLVSFVYLLPLVLVALFLVLAVVYSQAHPPSMLMIGRFLTGQPVDRRWVPLDDISRNLVAAVVTSEDARFCAHHGIDLVEMRSALDASHHGGPTRRAPTLPQPP